MYRECVKSLGTLHRIDDHPTVSLRPSSDGEHWAERTDGLRTITTAIITKGRFFAYQRMSFCIVSLMYFLLHLNYFAENSVNASKQHVSYIVSLWDSFINLMGLALFQGFFDY